MITPTASKTRIVIAGASSSIGRALAATLAQGEGVELVLAGRDVAEIEFIAADLRIRYGIAVTASAFDATDFASHAGLWKQWASFDGAMGLVVCFGLLAPQMACQETFELTLKSINVNFTGAASLLAAAANDLEQRKSGFLCAIGSVAGDRGRQSNYVYGSPKAALATFLSGLRQRLAKVKVPVLLVKPGFTDTSMTWGLPGMFLVAAPEKVAADIARAIRRRRNSIYTPWFWRYIMLIIRSVPEFIFKKAKL